MSPAAHRHSQSLLADDIILEVYTRAAVLGEPALFLPERTRVVNILAATPASVITSTGPSRWIHRPDKHMNPLSIDP